jgi:hypothetical protein
VTVPAPRLDDLTWDEMMAAIRRRIPAESGGTWTLHAPSDPGVTLLELFAHLLEQRLFWLDQVPDSLVTALLRLLDVEPPRPARPAATVLRLTADGPAPVVVPAGTAFARDALGQVVFTLDDEVTVLPLDPAAEVTVRTDADRTADLRAGRGVPLFPAGGPEGRVRFTLPLADVPDAAGWLSLLFELDAPAASPPSWAPSWSPPPDVPPPAELTWSWFRSSAEDETEPFAEVVDGTAGFRRSGVVRLRLPDGWSTAGSGVQVAAGAATYSAPPVLRQVAVNVSAARHRLPRTATEDELGGQVGEWLRLPGQHLALPDARGRLLDAEVRLGEHRWTRVPDFTGGSAADRIFVLDRDEGEVRFGDGLTGRIPRRADRIRVDYHLGGGREGNGGLTGNWRPLDDSVAERGVLAAANVVPAAGGTDPETVAAARDRAAGTLLEVTRAVTAADHVTLARTTPGVAIARAHAAVGAHPGFPCAAVPGAVTVHVVPDVPRDEDRPDLVAHPVPDRGALCAVRDRLDEARLLTAEVFVRGPAYRPVTLRVDLSGRPADRVRVSAVVRAALRRFLDPLVGGDDGDGWPFGGPLRPSALLRAARRATGDLADVAAVAVGVDGAEPDEDCRDVELRPGELPALTTVRLRTTAVLDAGEGLL